MLAPPYSIDDIVYFIELLLGKFSFGIFLVNIFFFALSLFVNFYLSILVNNSTRKSNQTLRNIQTRELLNSLSLQVFFLFFLFVFG